MSFATRKALKRHIQRMHGHDHTNSKMPEPSKQTAASWATSQGSLLDHKKTLTAAENHEVFQVAEALFEIQQTTISKDFDRLQNYVDEVTGQSKPKRRKMSGSKPI